MHSTSLSESIRTGPCPQCHVCGSDGSILYRDLRDRIFSASGSWNIKQCNNEKCQLLWLDPMPLEEDIGRAYEGYYTHFKSEQSPSEQIRKFEINRIYSRLRMLLSAVTGLRGEERALQEMYTSQSAPARLLDVGCGTGEFLNRMQLAGWRVEGLDFDPDAVREAKSRYGFHVTQGDLRDAGYVDSTFDFITMSHVVEHVHDPAGLLRHCHRVLKPGGTLVIVTPNACSFGHQRFRQNWRGLETPRHLHIFSLNALSRIAQMAGFSKPEVWTSSARSQYIFRASVDLLRDNRHAMLGERASPLRILVSLCMQQYERFRMKRDPQLGEEAILRAVKG